MEHVDAGDRPSRTVCSFDGRLLRRARAPSDLVTLGRRSDDPSTDFALFRNDDAMDCFEHRPAGAPKSWRNQLTMRSLSHLLDDDGTATDRRISPTPLLMIIAPDDDTMPVDAALGCFDEALEPEELVMVDGGHYGVHLPERSTSTTVAAATRWLGQHL